MTPGRDLGLIKTTRQFPPSVFFFLPHRPFESFPEAALVIGYGVTGENKSDSGVQRAGIARISGWDETSIEVDGEPATTCFGDSGGPLVVVQDGVDTLAGIHSESSCNRTFDEARIDANFEDFIRPFIVEHRGDPCVADDYCYSSWFCADGAVDPDCDENSCAEDGVCEGDCYPDLDCLCPNGPCPVLELPKDSGCRAAASGSQGACWWGLFAMLLWVARSRHYRAH